MKPVYKILSVCAVGVLLWFGFPKFLANTQPNMEVVIVNQSDQPIAFVYLQTEKTGKDIRLRGMDVGGELTIKFHNDSEDKYSLRIGLADGKEIRQDGVFFEPGFRTIETVTEETISSRLDLSPAAGK